MESKSLVPALSGTECFHSVCNSTHNIFLLFSMNVTTNGTIGNGTFVFPKFYFFPKLAPDFLALTIFLIVFIGLAGIVGNSLIFYLEYKRKRMTRGQTKRPLARSLTMYFIKSLALSDLLSCIIHTPLGVVWLVDGSIKNNLECKLHRITLMSLSCITILNITFIAIERFLAVYFPLKAPTVTVSKVCVLLAWFFGFVVGIIHIVPYKSQRLEVGPILYTIICVSSPPDESISSLLVGIHTTIMFVVPNIIICVTAIYISKFLRQRRRQVNCGKLRSSERVNAWRIKDTAMFVKIIFAFYIPYTTFFATNILKEINVIKVNFLIESIIQLSTFLLAFSNCAINPIIYMTSSNDFKKVANQLRTHARLTFATSRVHVTK